MPEIIDGCEVKADRSHVKAYHGDYDLYVQVDIFEAQWLGSEYGRTHYVFRLGMKAKTAVIVPASDVRDPIEYASVLARQELSRRIIASER